ncbi:MAG: arginine--tRNA ligase, partial [Luteibaculum sp.]
MQQIAQILSKDLKSAVEEIFGVTENLDWSFQETRKEFDGEITLVTFPLTKALKSKPEEIGNKLGQRLKEESHLVADFNVVKGFLNLVLQDEYWLEQFNQAVSQDNYGHGSSGPKRHVMVEFSSPNTNKPLHLGHLRNIFLGHSVSRILEANGHAVKKVQIINDRGIHICKSMLAWQMFGNGETPANAKLKGDKFVGKYYVLFDVKYKEEQKRIQQELLTTDVSALKEASTWKKAVKGDEEWQLISKAKQEGIDALDERASAKFKAITDRLNKYLVGAQEMLRKWEQEDEKVRALWETMNGWVYDGFNATYREMGVEFDKLYYESNTYLKGRDVVMEGLEKNVFYQREDKSIWVDLTQDGLDEKLLLRSDGTAVYMTQDIGT